MAHPATTAINTGRSFFGKDPFMGMGMAGAKFATYLSAINHSQWLAFGKRSYQQLKCCLVEKPVLKGRYVFDDIDEELTRILDYIDKLFGGVQRGGVLPYCANFCLLVPVQWVCHEMTGVLD